MSEGYEQYVVYVTFPPQRIHLYIYVTWVCVFVTLELKSFHSISFVYLCDMCVCLHYALEILVALL